MSFADYFWTNILMLGLGTFAIRYSIVSISGKIQITDSARELFSYIPAAVLPALVAPMVFSHEGSVAWLAGKERALVLVLTTAICALTRSTLVTILFGLVGLYFIHLV